MANGIQVIGAGFGRTGTMSLKAALEKLGFGPCYHMTEVFSHPGHADLWRAAWRGEPVDWDVVLANYRATLDWPACTFYEEILECNPGAKVILSVRDREQWYESVRNTIYELSVGLPGSPLARAVYRLMGLFIPAVRIGREMVGEIVWQGTFDGRFKDREYAMEVFDRHNEEVQRRIPPERLLVYEVKDGWVPLCEFLGAEAPDEPFPRLNDTVEMRRRILGIRAATIAVPAALVLLVAAVVVLSLRRIR